MTLKPDDLRTTIIITTPNCSSGKCYKFTLIHQETEHTAKNINKRARMYCCRSPPSAGNYISPSATTVSIKSLQTETDGLIQKVPS